MQQTQGPLHGAATEKLVSCTGGSLFLMDFDLRIVNYCIPTGVSYVTIHLK